VKGEIRNDQSRTVQGRRAGFVSQVAAGLLDAVTIVVVDFAVLALYGVIRYLVTGKPFEMPRPSPWVNALSYFVIGVAILSSAWSGSGRAPGMAVIGLRVVDAHGGTLSPRRALWRAVLAVATLGLGLVTVLFSRKNRSLYDVVCGSATVYAWRPALPESRQNR
jgi:uncharacterized RDD family membrane protein YckC